MDATNGDMTDYQGIVKLLIEQHRQQYAASGLSGQGGGRGDSDARRGGSANVIEEEELGEALNTFTGRSGGTNKQGRPARSKLGRLQGRLAYATATNFSAALAAYFPRSKSYFLTRVGIFPRIFPET